MPIYDVQNSAKTTADPNENVWPFKNFTLDHVTEPEELAPEGFDKKIHPEWKLSFGLQHFVSPCGKTLAWFDYKAGAPCFLRRGYLRRNERIPEQFRFCHDPDFDPFPKPKKPGM